MLWVGDLRWRLVMLSHLHSFGPCFLFLSMGAWPLLLSHLLATFSLGYVTMVSMRFSESDSLLLAGFVIDMLKVCKMEGMHFQCYWKLFVLWDRLQGPTLLK